MLSRSKSLQTLAACHTTTPHSQPSKSTGTVKKQQARKSTRLVYILFLKPDSSLQIGKKKSLARSWRRQASSFMNSSPDSSSLRFHNGKANIRQLAFLMLSVNKWSIGLDQKAPRETTPGSYNLLSSYQGSENRGLAKIHIKMTNPWGFPGSPVVRTRHFHCRGPGSISD